MEAPVSATAPSILIRGTPYPVLLPKLRDPRLHLAATITSLQVIGQIGFHFEVSIAQILLALGTCAALEVAIAFRSQRVILWPASAMLTGNGVAFVLRVPGTAHGDWWTLRGWWIFVGTAAISLLSKHVIKWRGEHIFNPSNIGLVICFLALGRNRAAPLDFWWGPTSAWLALALVIIVTGGFAILWRLKLLRVALGFWVSFAAGIGVLALAGHSMTARWHLGPISGFHLWWALITSPEVLVFLFFMITDPKTAPRSPSARLVYAVALGVLSSVLIAPTTTEFAAKVALLGSLAIVCVAMPLLRLVPLRLNRRIAFAAAPALAGIATAAIVLASPPTAANAFRALPPGALPPITILPSHGVQTQLDRHTAELIAHDLLAAKPAGTNDRLRIWLVQGREQGSADGDRATLRRDVPPPPDRRRALGASHRNARDSDRAGAYEQRAGRHPADERRVVRRARLPAGLVPLRHVERDAGDDGRRRLLARLQRRRPAGPLRRQLVLERGHRPVAGARRPAAVGAVRERRRHVPQRHGRGPRRPAGAG